MRNKIVKRLFAGVLTFAVAVAGFVYVPDSVQAETSTENTTSVVQYQDVKYSVFETCINAHKAPECTLDEKNNTNIGYLFAGWYKTADNTSPIEKLTDVTDATADTLVYAKFVPSYLAGIACQVDVNSVDTSKNNLRVVSLVDSTNYKAVGFNVYGRYNADQSTDGSNESEWPMYSYSSTAQNAAESTNIYSGLYEYDTNNNKTLRTPEYVFGESAKGFYFTTVSLTGIGEKTNSAGTTYDFRDATMAVKPYWITLDGTYVEGIGEFNRVKDYANNIVNVSVNLKDATAIAAGMLNITVPGGFAGTLKEVEGGRVFEEMKSAVSGNTIKCVGNVSVTADSTKANEVYVNLRFSVDSLTTVTKGATEFAVDIPTNGFCSIEEEFDNGVEAWNVKY